MDATKTRKTRNGWVLSEWASFHSALCFQALHIGTQDKTEV
jgi:hypothetical protein